MALLAMMGEAVPVEAADGTAAAVAAEGVEGAEHDLDTAEHLLEIIEKKIFKLLKVSSPSPASQISSGC